MSKWWKTIKYLFVFGGGVMLVFFLLMNDLFKSSIYQSLYGPFICNFFYI